ncbi:hypothetical protein PVP_XSN000060 [Vibrio phage PVP-XSN]|uniref:Uncharacterized protein n=1 Tax=Vibrio phage PVP-XSN TaxID=3056214 RepID=A0AAX3Y6H9_9CAUD|nr:hypothetical protein PVP_XSN000025 [Vibrio phage PVP-XSN]
MEYSVKGVMERSGLSETKAINFINELRHNVIAEGGKCVRQFVNGKLDKIIVGQVPKSKYQVK